MGEAVRIRTARSAGDAHVASASARPLRQGRQGSVCALVPGDGEQNCATGGKPTSIRPSCFPARRRLAGTQANRQRPRQRADSHLSVSAVQNTFRLARAASGLPAEATVHTLRHCYATHLLEEGVSLRLISQYLGHASLETTLIYTHLDPAQRGAARAPRWTCCIGPWREAGGDFIGALAGVSGEVRTVDPRQNNAPPCEPSCGAEPRRWAGNVIAAPAAGNTSPITPATTGPVRAVAG